MARNHLALGSTVRLRIQASDVAIALDQVECRYATSCRPGCCR